ncbi:MAG: DUF3293 domain-containing protein, partial [Acidimicrobiales bacterium]
RNYQVPPTELTVKNSSGKWVGAREAAREMGPFTVLTSDNPFSKVLGVDDNTTRRAELFADLQRRGVRLRHTKGRDPMGEWPVEEGFALLEQSVEFALQLARAWDQFAIYEVTEDEILVRSVDSGDVLA